MFRRARQAALLRRLAGACQSLRPLQCRFRDRQIVDDAGHACWDWAAARIPTRSVALLLPTALPGGPVSTASSLSQPLCSTSFACS